MSQFEGSATMYMRMPMSSTFLPIQGTCKVDDKRVTLNFHFTGLEFDMPSRPQEGRNDYDFKIRGGCGNMTITIGWLDSLKCFTGVGKMDEDETTILTFNFFSEESPMRSLPKGPYPV